MGASGSGKSTIAKMLTGVEKPTSGSIRFGDTDVASLKRRGLRDLRKDVQMVFQDPYAALNPLHTVEYALTRPVVNYTRLRGTEARARVLELLETVGLTPVEQFAAKLPHQLSGGQRQRVVIARALASDPQVLIADEPVSMLDVSLRAGVLALLEDLRERWGISMLYIIARSAERASGHREHPRAQQRPRRRAGRDLPGAAASGGPVHGRTARRRAEPARAR